MLGAPGLSLVGDRCHLLWTEADGDVRTGEQPQTRARPSFIATDRAGMRVAVIGSGISGLMSAWLLSRKYAVTLFEAQDYLGGHTHTHRVEAHGRQYAVDSGFI